MLKKRTINIWKKDNCVPTQFFKNQMVTGDNKYTYDALYRLKIATGRENDAAVNFTSADNTDDSPFILKHGANDAMNMQSYTQNYNYDAVGNIVQMQHSAAQGSYTRNYTYNSGNNRLLTTQIGSNTPYSYNHHTQHGYLTSLPHLSVLKWNFKEEVVATSKQVVNSGTPETTYYQYDSKGKRLRKVTENASTSSTFTKKDSRVYIEGYEFYENFSGTAYVTHSLSLIDTSASLSAGGGQRFVMIESTTNPALAGYLVRYQHPNHQSSSTLETDDVGAVISYEEYHPFGTTSYQAMEKPVRAAAKRYRYTGMERDEETGLSYHSARYYISWLGRWLSSDPIGLEAGINVYEYCANNAVNHTDEQGTQINSKYVAQRVSTAVFKQIPKDLKFLTKEEKQTIKDRKIASLLANTEPRQDKLIGTNDPEYWLTHNNYNPDMANFIATKNLAEKEKGFTKFSVWFGYGAGWVAQLGVAPGKKAKAPDGLTGAAKYSKPTNFKAQIDIKPEGQNPTKTKPLEQAAIKQKSKSTGTNVKQSAPVVISDENNIPASPAPPTEVPAEAVTVEYKGIQTSIYRAAKPGTLPKDFFTLLEGEYQVKPNSPKKKVSGLSLLADVDEASQLGSPLRIVSIPDELQMIPSPSNRFKSHFDIIPKDATISEESFQSLLNKIKYEIPHQ